MSRPQPQSRKGVPLGSTIMGRRIKELEAEVGALRSQRVLFVRAVGALGIAVAKLTGDESAEPAVLIPFDELNVARDVGFTTQVEDVERDIAAGLLIVIAKPVHPDEEAPTSEAIIASMLATGTEAESGPGPEST